MARADMDCHVYLNLRGGNVKQESAEREKMTEKREYRGGKAKRKHRDRCEKIYIPSQKCFIED